MPWLVRRRGDRGCRGVGSGGGVLVFLVVFALVLGVPVIGLGLWVFGVSVKKLVEAVREPRWGSSREGGAARPGGRASPCGLSRAGRGVNLL